jgi:hypothetical protein
MISGHINDLRMAQSCVFLGKVLLPREGKSLPEMVVAVAEQNVKKAYSEFND